MEDRQNRPTTANRRNRAAELLLAGDSPAVVASKLGVARRTLSRYMSSQRFTAELTAARGERLRALADRAGTLGDTALLRLDDVASDTNATAGARVAACRTLLEFLLRAVEAHELQERIAALELALPRREGEQ